MWLVSSVTASLLVVLAVRAQQQDSSELEEADDQRAAFLNSLGLSNFYSDNHLYAKRDLENAMPGVLRFGKRDAFMQKKEMPGVLRFGKRSAIDNEKKSMPGVLRFGKRGDMPGVLRFGKREMPGVLRFGKRDDIPGVLRFGKRDEIPGVLRFGKREIIDEFSPSRLLLKKSVPGVLRFGRK